MENCTEAQFVEALTAWTEAFAHQSMQGLISYIRANGMSVSQVGALMHVHRMGPSAVGEISHNLGVTNAAVSQLLDRLVSSGFVNREEDPADRRAKRVELTARGRTIVHEILDARRRWFRALASSMTNDERSAAARVLTMLSGKTAKYTGGIS